MVGTMHLRMTVKAPSRGIDGIGRTVMRSGMTALAKHWITHLEHRPFVGAVRIVAVAAILCDGLMAMKEGTALAGVAAVARIVTCSLSSSLLRHLAANHAGYGRTRSSFARRAADVQSF